MKITPQNMSIRALFQTYFFTIPRFQRPYSWDAENVQDFWNDVMDSESQEYFIGSMVFFKGSDAQDLSIVDGQQRLTTVTIFLAALRDTLSGIGESGLARGIQNIIERPDMSNKVRYVLKTESSYPYFQEHVQKMGDAELDVAPGDEENGIANAYDFAQSGLENIVQQIQGSSYSPKKKKTMLRQRLEVIRDALVSLEVILVQLDDEDDAYVVFETLNTRGKDLEPKDLIKTHLTRLIPAKGAQVDTVKVKWEKMLEALDASAENLRPTSYLHHQWLSLYEYTPERTLYKKAKKRIKKDNAVAYLNQVLADVPHYRKIFEPNNFSWTRQDQDIKRSILALALFRVRQPTPLLLTLLRSYYTGDIGFRQIRDTIRSIERFHFLNTAIAGQSSSGGVSMMYAAAARELAAGVDRQKRSGKLQELRAKLKDRAPDWAVFKAGFADLHFSTEDTRDKPIVAYALEKADKAMRGVDPPIDYGGMTIEHISPQNPPAGNPRPPEYGSLGNLILVGEGLNGKLKNKSFAEKKRILRASGVPMDPVLAKARKWGTEQIKARTDALAKLLFDKVS